MSKRKEPVAVIETEPVARRWWQPRKIRLVCTCGWRSSQTWPARPMVEFAYTDRITQRVASERHFSDTYHEFGSRDA